MAAADADEALAFWREEGGIEFVLSDVVLRGSRSGSQMLAEMRREAPGLDCLLMTGYADSELDVASAEIADVEVIMKPFPMKTLVQRTILNLQPVGTIAEVS